MKNFQIIRSVNKKTLCPQLMKKTRWSLFKKAFIQMLGRPITLQRLYCSKKLYVYLVMMMFLITLSVQYSRKLDTEDTELIDYHNSLQENIKYFVIESKGEGCVMPQLDLFDDEAMKHDRKLATVTCAGKDWVECFLDECFVAESIKEELSDGYCVYRDIVYIGNRQHHMGAPTNLSAHQKYKLVQSDHVDVSCIGTSKLRPDPLRWSGHKTGLRHVPLRKRSFGGARLNVLMLCLASMSKNGFIRHMPRSHAVLQEMGAFMLNGYNILGAGSPAALFPILTGNYKKTRKNLPKDTFDEDSFIFYRLSRMGYRTAFFEDVSLSGESGGTFGFPDQPTDHYLLPLFLQLYENTSKSSTSFCIGDIPLHGLLLNLTYQFYQLNGKRFSFTLITETGRDDYNLGPAVDGDLAFFLRRIQQGGKLKETVLLVMGDHGPSFPSIRETLQGKLEERLPLMAIVVPDSLKQTRPDAVAAMGANLDVLTTPFDIHTTLTDILGIQYQRNRYRVPGADTERGLTLLQPIPMSRSCGEAAVAPYWCACADWQPVSPLDSIYKEIGDLMGDFINNLLDNWRLQCAHRKLVSVEQVLLLLPNNRILKYKKKLTEVGSFGGWFLPQINCYQAKIIMGPGRAVFEATMKHFNKGDYFTIAEEDIRRLDEYANESACMKTKSTFLKKYCYCRE